MTRTTADTSATTIHAAARTMPRWIVTRHGLLRAVQAVDVEGEPLMVYSAGERRLVFRIAGNGCGHLEEVAGDLRRRALAAVPPASGT